MPILVVRQVVARVGMAMWAMHLGLLLETGHLASISTTTVLLMSNRFKMLRIHTRWITAEVIQLETCGDRPHPVFVEPSVS